jgi:threonine aldolase
MNFASDNAYGVSQPILQALERANVGAAIAYGADDLSDQLEGAFCDLFERRVKVFQVVTGTAANALSIAVHSPPYGAVLCHEESHIMVDECGAPEFFSGGAKLVGLAGAAGKLTPGTVAGALAGFTRGNQHHVQPAVLSLTQATEAGTVYSVEEIAALADLAHRNGLAVHMDGARFANALVGLGVTPAELTWRAGIDVLSFGATKNGAMAAEAVVLFAPDRADELMYRRKRAGHLISKSRFVAAQLLAFLGDGHWLDLARSANDLARRLAEGIEKSGVARLAFPVEANEMFAILPRDLDAKLRAAGAVYYQWPGKGPGGMNAVGEAEVLVRLVTSFATPEADVEAFLALIGNS